MIQRLPKVTPEEEKKTGVKFNCRFIKDQRNVYKLLILRNSKYTKYYSLDGNVLPRSFGIGYYVIRLDRAFIR